MADQVTASLAQAKVLVIQGMAGKAPRINAENQHWEVYDNTTEQWVDTGVEATGAKGDDGEDGVSPTVTITEIARGHRVKITDAEHPNGQNFDVMDGEDGPAPFEIPITESGGAYSTTATAEQIRAAKENSIFVSDGEARIKALLWLPCDEDLDMLIGMQMLNGTIMSVAATVSTDRVSIAVEQTPVPVLATDHDMEDWDSGKTVDAAVLKTALEMFAAVLKDIYGVLDEKADKTEIPAAVTEQDVAGWGFTKNTGDYTKPSTGIPKSDLAQAVQTSLGKADSALQQHQSLSAYQTKAITDTGGYYATDTVEGALQEIGAELSGINTLIGSGVIS